MRKLVGREPPLRGLAAHFSGSLLRPLEADGDVDVVADGGHELVHAVVAALQHQLRAEAGSLRPRRELGQLVYVALGKADAGLGLIAGLSIALVAMIGDRIIQAWARQRGAAIAGK